MQRRAKAPPSGREYRDKPLWWMEGNPYRVKSEDRVPGATVLK